MLSRKFWYYVQLHLQIGYTWRCCSFYIQPTKSFYKVIGGSFCVKLVTTLLMILNFITFISYGLSGFTFNDNPQITLFFFGMMSLCALFIGVQFWHLRSIDEISDCFAKFVEFSKQLRKSIYRSTNLLVMPKIR